MSKGHASPGEPQPSSLLSGTAFLILIQVVSRGLTFLSNQAILSNVSHEILGVATQLELYSITVLYFSREFIRTAIQRQPSSTGLDTLQIEVAKEQRSEGLGVVRDGTTPDASQTVVNMSYLSLALGMPLAIILGASYLRFSTEEVRHIPYFQSGLKIVCVSCFFELATEPFFAIIQQRLLYKTRAIVETVAAISRSLAICSTSLWAVHGGRNIGVLPFAFGHMVYASILLCGYLCTTAYRHNYNFSFLPTPIQVKTGTPYIARGLLSQHLLSLGANVYLQLIVKHLLTQGDSMILAALSSLEDQGVYSWVSNYGGLVARVIFQPLEESSRTLFARLVNSNARGNNERQGIEAAKLHLIEILRFYGIMSLLAFVIGPAVVPKILKSVIGAAWMTSKVQNLLALYCYYIPFLAFNGIMEAFVASTADSAEMRMQAAWMAVFSTCYAALCFVFLRVCNLGAYGVVLANIVNMFIRIIWSYTFIKNYLRRHGSDLRLVDVSPRLLTFGYCVVGFSIMSAIRPSSNVWTETLKILGAAVFCSLLILFGEKHYLISQCQKFLRQAGIFTKIS